jgi:ATP-dependent DNA helicase RecG
MVGETDLVGMIPGVGPVAAKALEGLGIRTIGELLRWYPREYLDGSNPLPVRSLPPDRLVAVRVTVQSVTSRPTRQRGVHMVDALCSDESGELHARWFNQSYLKQKLVPGSTWILMGVAQKFGPQLAMASPLLESEPKILAIYGQTKGVTSKMLRGYVEWVLTNVQLDSSAMPADFVLQEGLMGREEAVRIVHAPHFMGEVAEARRYLAYEEAFAFFARLSLGKREASTEPGVMVPFDVAFLQQLTGLLPFELTAGQKRAVWDVVQEMGTGRPMTRLLNGDVGSGKTVVAAFSSAVVAKAGYQSVILVPTEILAVQHRQSIARLLEPLGIQVALWTSAKKEDSSRADVVVGTHAVLQQDFSLPRLGLVVIDEQHRFGVRQRQLLRATASGAVPHLLSMTATPIPRTLALALYGDLTVSVLPEKPKDRLPIFTRIVSADRREEMHQRILGEIQAGHQVFVICPLIQEKAKESADPESVSPFAELGGAERDAVSQKTVTAEADRLRLEHPEYGVIEVLHGKMKPDLKKEVMERMAAGKINVLVSTSVVEVGVDVPNATVMVIEGAERFGLAQLHQFRGRVGRSAMQSYCFLCPQLRSPDIFRRLQVLVDEQSGFAVAEQDLALRGPGEFSGAAQAGLPDFRMASLTDLGFLTRIHVAVRELSDRNPDLLLPFAEAGYSGGSLSLE